VQLREVGPRDGLQNEREVLPVETRVELIRRLAGTGLRRIEAASFVNPERVPQMAGAEEVAAALPSDGVVYTGLALNERGYDRLRDTGLGEVSFALAATETFSQRNAGALVEESVAAGERIVERARADGIRSSVTISVAFGCPFEGRVDPDTVVALAERLAAADELVLADTIGVATPAQVRPLVERVKEFGKPVGGHFHNTRNTGPRLVGWRPRRLPVRPEGDRQRRDGGSRLPARRRGDRERRRPRPAARGLPLARGGARQAARGARLPGGAVQNASLTSRTIATIAATTSTS
jgi:hypothetical protein